MADSLSTIGSIATFLFNSYPNLSAGVSGNLVIISDMARQHVSNYTGIAIGSNSIGDSFQPAIVDFARADLIDLLNADGGNSISLAELSIDDDLSAEGYRKLGEMKLFALGKSYKFSQSLS